MKTDRVTKLLLSLIAIALLAIAIRPYVVPARAHAQTAAAAYPFYFEPGVQMLRASDGSRQVYGRVVVDLRTGKVWGFPTMTTDTYPFNALESKPQTSHPFPLGRFALEDTDSPQK